MSEIWKQVIIGDKILNFEVSSMGNIRRIDNKRIMKLNKRPNGCVYYQFTVLLMILFESSNIYKIDFHIIKNDYNVFNISHL